MIDLGPYLLLFETTSHPALIVDDRGIVLEANVAASRELGRSRTALLGLDLAEIVGSEAAAALARQQQTAELDVVLRLAEGRRREARLQSRPWHAADRSGALVVLIADHGNEAAALHTAREQLRALLISMPVVLWALDDDGRVTLSEGRGLQSLGLRPGELVGRTIEDLYGDHPDVIEAVRNAIEGRCTYDVREVDGLVWENRYAKLRAEDGTVLGTLCVSVEVTERARAEERLRESEQSYRALVDGAPSGIVISAGGTVEYANDAAAHLLGARDRAALCGRPTLTFVPRDDHARARRLADRAQSGELAGRPWQLRVRRLDGTLRRVELVAIPFRQRGVDALHLILRDVTEQLAMEETMRQSLKMEAIGVLAGGVAHDFNNILTAIQGNNDLLIERLAQDPDGLRCADEIRRAVALAAELTQKLLAVSRQQTLTPRAVDLVAMVRDMGGMLAQLLPSTIELMLPAATEPVWVRADAGQLERVLLNLVVNARDAMPAGGRLRVDVRCESLSEARAKPIGKGAGECAVLEVADTGHGMDEETRARIFEPFFSTKREKGTGLGLPTVFGIVTQSGGTIEVDSAPERGTTFRVLLPCLSGRESTEVGSAGSDPLHGHETVLVVEDDAAVRGLELTILRKHGYRVLEASTIQRALQLAATAGATPDLLVTDMVMPDGNGIDLAMRLQAMHPSVGVVFVSGYLDEPGLPIGAAFLHKPFTAAMLLRTARSVLDAANPTTDAR